jgi:hypothetical protein
LVTKKLWDEANKAQGRKPVHTGASEHLLLRGIITCANCGHKMMVGSTRGKVAEKGKDGWQSATREKIPAYQCRNHACDAHAYANANDADAYVVKFVMGMLSNFGLQTGRGRDPQEAVLAERELEEAEEALTKFKANRKAITIMGQDEWNGLLEEYMLARDQAQMALEALREDDDPGYDLIPSLWAEWTAQSRNEFLSKVLIQCEVQPAHGRRIPVEERITPTLHIPK